MNTITIGLFRIIDSAYGRVFYLLGNFVEIVLVSKNAPRGSHCGGAENVAIATRCRRRMSQATFFIRLINGKYLYIFY